MAQVNVPGIAVAQQGEGTVKLPLGLAAAAGAAIVLGLVYGVASRFIGEHSYAAILIGAVSGLASVKLAGGTSKVLGVAAAVFALVGIVVGKLLIPAPAGMSWIAYHTTWFDILFCYLANPVAAFAAGATGAAHTLLRRLPF